MSRYSVHTYIRPVRQLLTWASSVGEDIQAKPQLPRRSKPIRDVLSRKELDRLEDAFPNERDKLIVRIFGDCGLRLDELTRLAPEDVIRFNKHAYLRVLGKRNRRRDVPVPPMLLGGWSGISQCVQVLAPLTGSFCLSGERRMVRTSR